MPVFFSLAQDHQAKLHMLSSASDAACLDGSPYGYYYRPPSLHHNHNSKTSHWTIYMQGGGWCVNEDNCWKRAQTYLGSSKYWHAAKECTCYNPHELDCHCVVLPYCDGASFAGFRTDPWPLRTNSTAQLWFRGRANWQQAVQDLLQGGFLAHATHVVLTGSSAGGLATLVHADEFFSLLPQRLRLAVALPQAGFFLDHPRIPNAPPPKTYTQQMHDIYHWQNVSLSADCQASFPLAPHLCFLAPHAISYVQTPVFLWNSKFDLWQLQGILGIANVSAAGLDSNETIHQAVVDYGVDFLRQLETVTRLPTNATTTTTTSSSLSLSSSILQLPHYRHRGQRGAFITSCLCHVCDWQNLTLGQPKKNGLDYFAEWVDDLFLWKNNSSKGTGSNHFHLDPSVIPNANNTLPFPPCSPFVVSPHKYAAGPTSLQRMVTPELATL